MKISLFATVAVALGLAYAPADAEEVTWSLTKNANGTGCILQGTSGGSFIRFMRSASLPVDVLSIGHPAWHFQDSQGFTQRTLVRYSDGDTVPYDPEFQPEYDGNYVSTVIQDLQVNVLNYLANEKSIRITEIILDVPGPEDLRFDFRGLKGELTGYLACLDIGHGKQPDAAAKPEGDELLDEDLNDPTDREAPSAGFCPPGTRGSPPDCTATTQPSNGLNFE